MKWKFNPKTLHQLHQPIELLDEANNIPYRMQGEDFPYSSRLAGGLVIRSIQMDAAAPNPYKINYQIVNKCKKPKWTTI